ncbi:hypothetical protein WMO44_07705 [Faecalibacterium sp. CLA-AA-H175]|uniref:Uncharacterized protein n=1 Tax=Faecalibacterium tardum TaxID=3133156 RepID=A0ABV1AXK7_9FIRM
MEVFSLCWQGGGAPPISFIVYHNCSGICSGQMAKIWRRGQKTFAKIEIQKTRGFERKQAILRVSKISTEKIQKSC